MAKANKSRLAEYRARLKREGLKRREFYLSETELQRVLKLIEELREARAK